MYLAKGTRQTLDLILSNLDTKNKFAYIRIGDGDINLANGENDSFNVCTPQFQAEMKEVFTIDDPGFIKCLPLILEANAEPNMFPGNHLGNQHFYDAMVGRIRPYLPFFKEVYNPIALCYQAVYHPDYAINFLKSLKKACLSNPAWTIGNQNINKDLLQMLFGSKANYIPTIERNSYSQIDQVWNKIVSSAKKDEYNVFVLFLGCSGRCLAKRIWKTYPNVFVFDFGSLMDALNGDYTRAWIQLSGFNIPNFLKQCKAALDEVD